MVFGIKAPSFGRGKKQAVNENVGLDDDEEYEDEVEAAVGSKRGSKDGPVMILDEEDDVGPKKKTRAEKARAMRRLIHTITLVLLLLAMVFVRGQATTAAAGLADWRGAQCEFKGYGGDCHSCEMIVQIYHSQIEPVANWKPEFTYSYHTSNYILRGEQFRCCNADPPTCCNFYDETKELFCDTYGPLTQTAKGDEACPLGTWDCMFRLKDDPVVEEYEIVPGLDETLPTLNAVSSVLTVSVILLALFHPFVWEQCRFLLVQLAETIVMRYFKSMKMRHDAQVAAERKKRKKPLPKLEELDLDDRPIDAPLVEPLSPWDANAAALRWKNVDPLMTGTVSAHALQPRGGVPLLQPGMLPGGMTMNMTSGASSIYGPAFLPGVPLDGDSEAEVTPQSRQGVETPQRVDTRRDWRFDHSRSPTAFPSTADRIRKGTARDLAGRGSGVQLRGAARMKPGTLRESGKAPTASLNRSGSSWGYSPAASDLNASCTSFYGEEGRLREEQRRHLTAQSSPLGLGSPGVKRKLNFEDDEGKYGFRAQHVAGRTSQARRPAGRSKVETNDRYAHFDGYVSFVRPPEKISTPKRPATLPPGLLETQGLGLPRGPRAPN